MTSGNWIQVCDDATWVLFFRKLDHNVYACESSTGEVSLVTVPTLVEMLRRQASKGVKHEMGGGSVGGA